MKPSGSDGRGGIFSGFNQDFDPAIGPLFGNRSTGVHDGAGFPKTDHGQSADGRRFPFLEPSTNRTGAAFSQSLIIVIGTKSVGVTADRDSATGITPDDGRNFG
jgi:hypothetical protein